MAVQKGNSFPFYRVQEESSIGSQAMTALLCR